MTPTGVKVLLTAALSVVPPLGQGEALARGWRRHVDGKWSRCAHPYMIRLYKTYSITVSGPCLKLYHS